MTGAVFPFAYLHVPQVLPRVVRKHHVHVVAERVVAPAAVLQHWRRAITLAAAADCLLQEAEVIELARRICTVEACGLIRP